MAATSPGEKWVPSAPPVTDADLREHPVVVLHYWAEWDGHDRTMDSSIASIRGEYDGRICCRSCDTDQPENRRLIHGIANIPAVGCFVRGKWFKSAVGLRPPDALRTLFDDWLAAIARGEPDAPKPRRWWKRLGL